MSGEIRGRDLSGDLDAIVATAEGFDYPEAAIEEALASLVESHAISETDADLLRPLALARVEDEPPVVFYVEGVNANGAEERYPADGYLEDTSRSGFPLVETDEEAIETARCALLESEGWKRATVYRRSSDGMHVAVRTLERDR